MRLVLEYQKTIKEIKEAFNDAFPYLKLEFLQENHLYETSFLNETVSASTPLGEITGAMKEGAIIITPDNTVAQVIQTFRNQFGLPVQVYRKAKSVWVQIKGTTIMTLRKQNAMAYADCQIKRHSRIYESILL